MLSHVERHSPIRPDEQDFGYVKAVVEDAKFDFKENSLHIRVVDHSHVAMIQMDIDSAAFDTWELDETSIAFEINSVRVS